MVTKARIDELQKELDSVKKKLDGLEDRLNWNNTKLGEYMDKFDDLKKIITKEQNVKLRFAGIE